ncbi:MAG: FG-GAP-like repeat-containing protein [Luteitalea sp.]
MRGPGLAFLLFVATPLLAGAMLAPAPVPPAPATAGTAAAATAAAAPAAPTAPAARTGVATPPTTTPATLTLRLIVVASEDEARQVIDQVTQGADFGALAASVSQDPTRSRGGLLGPTSLAALRPELRQALQGLTVGQMTRPVRIPTGFAVLSVEPDAIVASAEGASAANQPGGAGASSVAAVGAVRYLFDVSGFNDATVVMQRHPTKPAGWDLDPLATCTVRTGSLLEAQINLRTNLTSPQLLATGRPMDLAQGHFTHGQLLAYEGRMREAIVALSEALRIAKASVPAMRLHMEEAVGIAYLHKAMHLDEATHAPGDRCLLRVTPGPSFGPSEDVTHAIEHFMAYLRERPDDLEVRWLLNVAHIAAGTWPAAVPAAFRIDPAAFASGEDIGRFVDVAPQSGLRVFAAAGGVIVDDFDNDGRFDLITSSMDSCAPLQYYQRSEQGTFVNRSSEAGLDAQRGGLQIVPTDYDNDGCLDVLVLRGGWELPQRKSLLRNSCQGTFTDVTATSGLAVPPRSTQAVAWVDIDNDGRLDLFVGNEGGPAQLFRNRGDGTFEDIAARAGVAQAAFSKGVAAGDFDNDGWADLYVSNRGSVPNFLYRNNGNGTFTEMAVAAGVPGPGSGFVAWFFDYDNDGWLDIFATSYFTSLEETARTYLGLPHNATTLRLYRNKGDGTFADVTRDVGLDKVFMPMGANVGDVDNDGFLDIYLGTGSPSYGSLAPSVLLRNRAGKAFVDITASSGTGEWHQGHGVAFADLDNDGDQEIVFQVGGATPGSAHAMRLFENPGHGRSWLGVKLVGVKSNRAAIGARLTVTARAADGTTRVVHRQVDVGASFGASPLQQHVGLGDDVRRVDVEVWWPASGTRQHFRGVDANQVIEVKEFDERYRPRPRPRVSLTGAATP